MFYHIWVVLCKIVFLCDVIFEVVEGQGCVWDGFSPVAFFWCKRQVELPFSGADGLELVNLVVVEGPVW